MSPAEPRAVRDLTTRVRATIDERGMLKGGETVLLAVSGGPDSLAMLYVLERLARPMALTLHVAHFDHGWRPESPKDAAFVRRHAEKLGLSFHLGTDEQERPKGVSPEEHARNRRGSFLNRTASSVGASRIATAHNRDDQAETVLMRMLHGHGARGQAGIPPLRWYRMRPMIDSSRAQIEAFCRALRLRPLRDPSNENRDFLRNQVRLETLPYLRETFNTALDDGLVRVADIFRDEDSYLDTMAGLGAPSAPSDDGETARLELEAFRAIHPALQRRAIRMLTWTYDGTVHTAAHVERARRLALDGTTGKKLDLPEGLSVWVEYGYLVVGRTPSHLPPASPVDLAVPGEAEPDGWRLRVRSWIGAERPAEWPDGRQTCVLDADRVSFPLRVRRPRPGDRFRPLGMSRQKKVGDFFTDERVPKRERAGVPVITDADDRIVWVVGYRVDDRAKVTEATERYLWLEA